VKTASNREVLELEISQDKVMVLAKSQGKV